MLSVEIFSNNLFIFSFCLTAISKKSFSHVTWGGEEETTTIAKIWPSQLELQNTPTASLQKGKTPPNECPAYDTKQSDGEAPVKLKFWGMRNSSLLPSLPGLLWP